jgi:transcriptional regulator with XRE-family HTH domain
VDKAYDQLARSLGAAVRRRRLAVGKSQEDLAYEADLSVRQISEIESAGNPKLSSLWRIARTLGVHVDELLSEARRSKH